MKMYYYKRRTSPLRWAIIVLIILALGIFGYWFYVNYFSKIEVARPENNNEEALNLNIPGQVLSANLDLVQNDVAAKINNGQYETVLKDTILHQSDQVKTGANSLAILKLTNGAIIRLGENTEFILTSLDDKNVVFTQTMGRSYHKLEAGSDYQVKTLNVQLAAPGATFEVITNANLNYVATLDFSAKVNVAVLQDNETIFSVQLNPGEKSLFNLLVAKKDMMRLDTFDVKTLTNETWYKWNFDLDAGKAAALPVQELDFVAITDSLVLTGEAKETGVNLSWSVYNQDNFKNYKIVRSETKADLRYPDDPVIKSSLNKNLVSYLDPSAQPGKKYYYRVCVLKDNDKVACGNVLSLEVKAVAKDTVPPALPILTASVYEAGVNLTWSANLEPDFKEYRLSKTLGNVWPTYPAESYLAVKKNGEESYIDKEVNLTNVGLVYYRVCSLDISDNFACSNVITIENGQVK